MPTLLFEDGSSLFCSQAWFYFSSLPVAMSLQPFLLPFVFFFWFILFFNFWASCHPQVPTMVSCHYQFYHLIWLLKVYSSSWINPGPVKHCLSLTLIISFSMNMIILKNRYSFTCFMTHVCTQGIKKIFCQKEFRWNFSKRNMQ